MFKHTPQNCLIAIDGPAGVGKTTIGQMWAEQLNCSYLDTGAMYRAVSLLALQQEVKSDDIEGLTRLAKQLDFASRNATAEETTDGRQYTVLVEGQDVSQQLRQPEVEAIVSLVAAVPSVRTALVEKQREIAHAAGTMIMIGRDIGSVVLKDEATLKIYLDASPEIRAQRRSQQTGNLAKPNEAAKQNIAQRDRIDSQRATSPLIVPEGAVVIYTDNLTPSEVLQKAMAALHKVLEQKNG